MGEQAARLAAGRDPTADGAHAESIVGYLLEKLRAIGFEVVHAKGSDHFVSGPSGVFMVETKRWEYEPWHLQKAKRHATKLARELGIFVTPVICLARRRPADPYRDHGVWILGRDRLVNWLTAQRNETVEPGRLARLAERV